MQRKVFQVHVELEIQAVTCPGVWLCPNGKLSLQIYMLDSCIQTCSFQPVFPLLCHEKFVFYKTFTSTPKLADLQRLLRRECLYAELIQWQNCDVGNVLATFQSSLNELLYPSSYEGAVAGVDIDLLMEPAKQFPGIIAPKIEVNTKTTIEEILCSNGSEKCQVVNPKVIVSNRFAPKRKQQHQRKVCHSLGYHRNRRCSKTMYRKKPPFQFRKAEDELIARKPQGLEGDYERTRNCRCRVRSRSMHGVRPLSQSPTNVSYSKLTEDFLKRYSSPPKRKTKKCLPKEIICLCGNKKGHELRTCIVCSKYKYYFDDTSSPEPHFVKVKCGCSPTRKRDLYKECSPLSNAGVIKCCCDSCPTSQCYCSPQIFSSVDVDKDTNHDTESKENYQKVIPKKEPSLAQQLHKRLTETLSETTYPFVQVSCHGDPEAGHTVDCYNPHSNCNYCKDTFYKNLPKFCKKNYRKSQKHTSCCY